MVTYASSWLDPKEVSTGCPWAAWFSVRIPDWKGNGAGTVLFVVPGPGSRPWYTWGPFLPPSLQSGNLDEGCTRASHILMLPARHLKGESPLKVFGVMTACSDGQVGPCIPPPSLCFSDSSSCGEVSCRKLSASSLAWMPSTLWIWQSRKLSGLKLTFKFCTKKERKHWECSRGTHEQRFSAWKDVKNLLTRVYQRMSENYPHVPVDSASGDTLIHQSLKGLALPSSPGEAWETPETCLLILVSDLYGGTARISWGTLVMGCTKDQNLWFSGSLSCNIILSYWDASDIVVEAPEALTFFGFLHSCSRVFLWSGRLGHTIGLILK